MRLSLLKILTCVPSDWPRWVEWTLDERIRKTRRPYLTDIFIRDFEKIWVTSQTSQSTRIYWFENSQVENKKKVNSHTKPAKLINWPKFGMVRCVANGNWRSIDIGSVYLGSAPSLAFKPFSNIFNVKTNSGTPRCWRILRSNGTRIGRFFQLNQAICVHRPAVDS